MTNSQRGTNVQLMRTTFDAQLHGETAADLRALYRAAEARAARLRAIVEAGQTLASATRNEVGDAVNKVAQDAAHLAGFVRGFIMQQVDGASEADDRLYVPLMAPASEGIPGGVLVLEHRVGAPSVEDREALGLIAHLIGSTLAAHARETRLAILLTELIGAQEAERSRVAHELHDGVAQSAAALARRLELATDGEPADLNQATSQARALVRELRQVITGMRPPVLDDLGLAPALEQLVEEAGDSLNIKLMVEIEVRPVAAIETALFRIVQEGLNNARMHAGGNARVMVRITMEDERYVVEISDNGQGFAPDTPSNVKKGRGLGLAYMRERVERLGGSLLVTSVPGKGCNLLVELPAG